MTVLEGFEGAVAERRQEVLSFPHRHKMEGHRPFGGFKAAIDPGIQLGHGIDLGDPRDMALAHVAVAGPDHDADLAVSVVAIEAAHPLTSALGALMSHAQRTVGLLDVVEDLEDAGGMIGAPRLMRRMAP